MRGESYKMDVKTSVATGDAKPVGDLDKKVVQVALSQNWNGTLVVEGSVDGTNFETVSGGNNISASTTFDVPRWYKKMHVKTTAYTAGEATVTVGGFDVRAS